MNAIKKPHSFPTPPEARYIRRRCYFCAALPKERRCILFLVEQTKTFFVDAFLFWDIFIGLF